MNGLQDSQAKFNSIRVISQSVVKPSTPEWPTPVATLHDDIVAQADYEAPRSLASGNLTWNRLPPLAVSSDHSLHTVASEFSTDYPPAKNCPESPAEVRKIDALRKVIARTVNAGLQTNALRDFFSKCRSIPIQVTALRSRR